jgi:hypothetical protein
MTTHVNNPIRRLEIVGEEALTMLNAILVAEHLRSWPGEVKSRSYDGAIFTIRRYCNNGNRYSLIIFDGFEPVRITEKKFPIVEMTCGGKTSSFTYRSGGVGRDINWTGWL